MTACRYHQDYGGGRWRVPYLELRQIPPNAVKPVCRHPALWTLLIASGWDPPWTTTVCALHRRAVDARAPEFKNDPGRWTKI